MHLIDWDNSLPLAQRQILTAFESGETLNANRPAQIGDGPVAASDVDAILAFLTGKTDKEFALCAVRVACQRIRSRTSCKQLLTIAESVYDIGHTRPPKPEPKKQVRRTQQSRPL